MTLETSYQILALWHLCRRRNATALPHWELKLPYHLCANWRSSGGYTFSMSRKCYWPGPQCEGWWWSPALTASALGTLHSAGRPRPAAIHISKSAQPSAQLTDVEWLLQILISWDESLSSSNSPALAITGASPYVCMAHVYFCPCRTCPMDLNTTCVPIHLYLKPVQPTL